VYKKYFKKRGKTLKKISKNENKGLEIKKRRKII